MGVVAGPCVECEMDLLVVKEVEGWGRHVSEVAIGGVGGWALNLRHQCVRHLDVAADSSGGACLEVGMRGEIGDGTWMKT